MIDLHTHILPGIDDGVKTEDEAVEFARMAWADGVHTIVATPHCKDGFYVNSRDEILEQVHRLRSRLEQESIPLRILPGAEVHICPDLPARIADGRAATLANNGKTLLLELSLSQYPVELENLIFQLKLAGIEIVFAHPERIKYFQDDVRRYEDVVRLGGFGQVTTGSVLGTFGSAAKEFSEELLRKGLVHVVASDAHNVSGRPPTMTAAVEAMIPLVGERLARSMATTIPQSLVDGTTPEVPPVDGRVSWVAGFFSRWFGGKA